MLREVSVTSFITRSLASVLMCSQGAGNITDCTVIVTKKAASGISIR
ncbi:hypothetical protein QT322_01015 [Escherichia coli]|nr:hypothetical protein [Escherichia coli]